MEDNKPLTDEQLWGVPESVSQAEVTEDFCLYKKVRCAVWDNGCLAEKCIYE